MTPFDFQEQLLPLSGKLFRLALRIVQDSQEAEDIAQDTLLRLWSRREEMAVVENVEAYALATCRNIALDHVETLRRREVSLEDNETDIPDLAEPPDRQMMAAEQTAWVQRLINSLPEQQRAVLHLRDIEGYSYKEIAEATRLTENVVRVTLFRARQALKKALI